MANVPGIPANVMFPGYTPRPLATPGSGPGGGTGLGAALIAAQNAQDPTMNGSYDPLGGHQLGAATNYQNRMNAGNMTNTGPAGSIGGPLTGAVPPRDISNQLGRVQQYFSQQQPLMLSSNNPQGAMYQPNASGKSTGMGKNMAPQPQGWAAQARAQLPQQSMGGGKMMNQAQPAYASTGGGKL